MYSKNLKEKGQEKHKHFKVYNLNKGNTTNPIGKIEIEWSENTTINKTNDENTYRTETYKEYSDYSQWYYGKIKQDKDTFLACLIPAVFILDKERKDYKVEQMINDRREDWNTEEQLHAKQQEWLDNQFIEVYNYDTKIAVNKWLFRDEWEDYLENLMKRDEGE